jgi:predicted ester cyclase
VSTEQNKETVRRWFEDAIGGNDLAKALEMADQIFTDDFVDGEDEGAPSSRDEFKSRIVHSVFRIFSDIRVNMEGMVAEGDVVANRIRFSGVQHETFRGHPSTGGRIEFTATEFAYFRDGRICFIKGSNGPYPVPDLPGEGT